ncbi:MAG: Acetolactate synthase large subunit IlvB1 [Nitrosomonadaceae bacterium]|nr:Acetolactate synthase large subunit IlvB1 [Nitrosomonadaceae bacterium]
MNPTSTAANEIVKAVKQTGVSHVFCVPGESYLATLQAFGEEPSITLVSTRHEEGAGLMAEAYAKATGKPGICLVTRGPGLTHLSIALHTAHQDSTPLVAIVGQVPNSVRYRESFQELNIVEFVAPVSKWAAEMTIADRVPELVSKALYIATKGRPGPVVLSLPEDIDRSSCPAASDGKVTHFSAAISSEALSAALEMLAAAKRPCIIAGGGVIKSGATNSLIEFAQALSAPVYSAWRRFDVFPNSHPLYLGPLPTMPADFYDILRDADLIIAIGTRLDEFTSQSYRLPTGQQKLLFIGESPQSTEAFDSASHCIVITSDNLIAVKELNSALANSGASGLSPRLPSQKFIDAKKRYLTATTPSQTPDVTLTLDLEVVMSQICRKLPAHTRITSDAGTFSGWLYRFYKWEEPGTFFGPTAGGMGYAIPAAIGVKFANPSLPVVAFAGDGGFSMTMSEIETAVRHKLAGIVFIVFDNARYGTIALHQNNAQMQGSIGTNLGEIDFAGVARSLGAEGFRVTRTEELQEALDKALSADRPAVIHLVIRDDTLKPWLSFIKASQTEAASVVLKGVDNELLEKES